MGFTSQTMEPNQASLDKSSQAQDDQDQLARKLSRLLEISVTLNSTLDQEKLLNFILKTAEDVLECEGASIMLYDEKRAKLVFAAATASDPKELAKIPVPLEGSLAGTIFRENRPLVINEVDKDPRHFAQVGKKVEFKPRSIVGVPMRIRDKTTGVLEALNKHEGGFTQRDAQYLFIIASQAAVAIHNAQLLQSLQRAYDEVSKLDKLKSNFMAIASHELRTPLGLILGYATFLKEQAKGDLSKHANLVLNSAVRLQTLVEDLTNMNLMKVDSPEINPTRVSIQQAALAAYQSIKSTGEAKGHTIQHDLPAEPIYVHADQEKLELVFVNLLNNSIRFTPSGGQIMMRLYALSNEVWVEVQDNGYGIPADELENIFKEFYQVEDHMTRKIGGLGLGLAIARGLVELHYGRIWAESAGPGQGATIKFVLPQAQ